MKNTKRFYVYVLMDPSVEMQWEFNEKIYYYKPFYVGMGSGYRLNFHEVKKICYPVIIHLRKTIL